MNIGDLRGLITVLLLVLFVAVWVWTWSRKRKSQFDEAARMPLEDDEAPPQKDTERMK
jgi:cytochrome c oxidase cbb3-type subunit IV